MSKEPAVIIGLVGSIVLVVAQQVLSSGIVTSTNGVNILNLVVSVVPLITGILTRQFVTPAS